MSYNYYTKLSCCTWSPTRPDSTQPNCVAELSERSCKITADSWAENVDLLYQIAINRIGSPLVAQAGILGPVSTIFMGYLILSEPITWTQIIGMSLVIAAMWLLVRNDGLRKKPSDLEKSDDFEATKSLN